MWSLLSDIVYIGTIHPHHHAVTMMALNHGRHVLCEKPLAMNYTEAKEMIDFAREKKLFLMEVCNKRTTKKRANFVSFQYKTHWSHAVPSGGSRIFQMGGRCFVANGGAHILFSGKKCMKLKEIGLKWGGARLLAPCYSKITIFLWIILNSIMKTSYFTYLRIFWDILYKIIF